MQPTTVVALSGGLDSAVLTARYHSRGDRLVTVTLDYGQRHLRETSAAAQIAEHYGAEHILLNVPSFGAALDSALTRPDVPTLHGDATVVPNRNAVIASLAVGVALSRGAAIVALGMHAGDHAVYPDCRAEFVAALAHLTDVANEGFSPPRIEAPFLDATKADIVMAGVMFGAPLELTYSCYAGGENHCGECGACVERQRAFAVTEVSDPASYDAVVR